MTITPGWWPLSDYKVTCRKDFEFLTSYPNTGIICIFDSWILIKSIYKNFVLRRKFLRTSEITYKRLGARRITFCLILLLSRR